MDSEIIKRTLISIGKCTFLKIYPLLKSNPNIEVDDLVKAIPEYNKYSLTSQRTRLGHAKRIFKEGWVIQALEDIFLSNKVSLKDRKLAESFLKEIRYNS